MSYIDNMIVCCLYGMDGRKGAGLYCGSARLLRHCIHNNHHLRVLHLHVEKTDFTTEHGTCHACSQIIVASLLMLKVQMHFAFAVDNFHTVDCAVIYNLPSVIIQFTRGRVPVRVITLPRQSSVSAAHLTPPGLASSAVLLAVRDRPCLWSLHPPSPPPARHQHLQVT